MWRSARNAVLLALTAAMGAWTYQAVGAADRPVEEAWGFDMWCLEMQLYPASRCDAHTAEDLRDYQQYRADVEKFRQEQQGRLKRDHQVLQRFNRNLPGSPDRNSR